ncbi:MAG: hypothetical protein CVV18_05775 [Gammaproteobacteria bacterium HGW-Gammaproteobacteria-8]|nr:MAG: hypothetical protein CVV18_05775 [Gammaproteobacteria bacterium HGW-Gammaproteobacteria-8]
MTDKKVVTFQIQQQVCFRSPEAAADIINQLSAQQTLQCIRYEKAHKNRAGMLARLNAQMVLTLYYETGRVPVVLMAGDAERISDAMALAKSHIQCGTPSKMEATNELHTALVAMADATH